MSEKTCGHSPCGCPVETDRMYCSEACRIAAEREAPAPVPSCECKHVPCLSDVGKRGEHNLRQGAR